MAPYPGQKSTKYWKSPINVLPLISRNSPLLSFLSHLTHPFSKNWCTLKLSSSYISYRNIPTIHTTKNLIKPTSSNSLPSSQRFCTRWWNGARTQDLCLIYILKHSLTPHTNYLSPQLPTNLYKFSHLQIYIHEIFAVKTPFTPSNTEKLSEYSTHCFPQNKKSITKW